MSIANAFKKVANKTIMKFGGDIIIRRTTESTYDTTEGEIVKDTSDTTVKGLLENVVSSEVNELISQSDKKLNVSAEDLTFTPTTKDKIIISSIEYKIIQIDTDTALNEDVKYTFYLRA
jgi:hypothetical protein|tara:strand:- start:348 stop:704 length:357 start_codon:yes stop_codon:yes gene_type:complete